MGAVFIPFLVVASMVVLFFALALIEHLWRMDINEMRRRYERGQTRRMPKFKKKVLNVGNKPG